jgi:hypothetical protein
MRLPKLPARTHYLLIVLWAEGYPVYFQGLHGQWIYAASPNWDSHSTYSIELENHRLTSGPDGVTLDPLIA